MKVCIIYACIFYIFDVNIHINIYAYAKDVCIRECKRVEV